MFNASIFLAASADDGMHNHDSHLHQKLVDGENLEWIQKDKKFLNGLTDSQVAVIENIKGMVCDFCARGLKKTFIKKDKTVKRFDVDLNKKREKF